MRTLTGSLANLVRPPTSSMTTAAFLTTINDVLDDAAKEQLASMSSDLCFILGENDVPLRLQVMIGNLGFKTVTLFAVMSDDRAGLRNCCATLLTLDPAEAHLSGANKARVILHTAQVCASWHSATNRFTEAERVAADSRAQRLPVIVPRSMLIALRKKFETEHGRITDSVWPCAALVERILEEVEEGAFSAPLLTEVIAMDKGGDELTPVLDLTGAVKVRKAPKSIAAPRTTEEFRARLKTLAIAYAISAYKHSSRLWLRTSTMALWLSFVEHVLGDTVAGYSSNTAGVEARANWTVILNYEHAMRRLACRRVLYDDEDMATALKFAMKDLEAKEQFFITPTAFTLALPPPRVGPAAQRPAFPPVPPGQGSERTKRKREAQKARRPAVPKGGQKGRGKGAASKTTPDGRVICRDFNSEKGCSFKPKCRFVHACSNCLGGHRALDCTTLDRLSEE
jgi:hypothetical protein